MNLLIRRILTNEFLPGKLVPKGNYLELAVEAHKDIADEEIVQLDLGVLYLFEEYFMVFYIVLC